MTGNVVVTADTTFRGVEPMQGHPCAAVEVNASIQQPPGDPPNGETVQSGSVTGTSWLATDLGVVCRSHRETDALVVRKIGATPPTRSDSRQISETLLLECVPYGTTFSMASPLYVLAAEANPGHGSTGKQPVALKPAAAEPGASGKSPDTAIEAIAPTGAHITTLVAFTGDGAKNKGSRPGGLVQGPDGNFYGTTNSGGAHDLGTVFTMTPGGTLRTLVEFAGKGSAVRDSDPFGAPVLGKDDDFTDQPAGTAVWRSPTARCTGSLRSARSPRWSSSQA